MTRQQINERLAKIIGANLLLREHQIAIHELAADIANEKPAQPSLPVEAATGATDGVALIAAERQRQIFVEGWSATHDDNEHSNEELASAAVCYLLANGVSRPETAPLNETFWPWDRKWWKPSNDPIRNLVKAGALIAAEIDRVQRFFGMVAVPAHPADTRETQCRNVLFPSDPSTCQDDPCACAVDTREPTEPRNMCPDWPGKQRCEHCGGALVSNRGNKRNLHPVL